MSAQTEHLERVAAEERERLASHLDKLQHQIERAVDPTMLYERHTLPVLGAAVFVGVVLGALTKGDGGRHTLPGRTQQRSHDDDGNKQTAWAEMRGAAMGMVAARIGDIVYDMASEKLNRWRAAHAEDEPEERPRRRPHAVTG